MIKKIVLVLVWLMLTAMSISTYGGSAYVFALFSFASLAMLGTAFYKKFSYSYFFLAVLLFLGFWVKLVHHLLFPAPYVEAIGSFSNLSSAWDEVLWVATAAVIGLVVARLTWVSLSCFYGGEKTNEFNSIKIPHFYIIWRKYLWIFVIIFILFFAIINVVFGIHQIGLAPRTILAFPLNALIAWMLNFGLSTIIATFLWWDVCIRRQSQLTQYAVLLEALFCSVSMLSRGAFIFHFVPPLVVYYRNKGFYRYVTLRKMLLFLFLLGVGFALCFSIVDTLRGYYYRSNTDDFRAVSLQALDQLKLKKQEKGRLEALMKEHNGVAQEYNPTLAAELDKRDRELTVLEAKAIEVQEELKLSSHSLLKRVLMMGSEFYAQLPAVIGRALSLATNRWIGLEGVMALQSYPHKSFQLLYDGLSERYGDGIVPMYQHISKSIYTGMDPNQWKFGSLPGASALFFYSGSVLVVFLGMAMLTTLLHLLELIIIRVTKNPFLASLYGFVGANTVAQLGVVPRQVIPVMLISACGIACVGFVQSVLMSAFFDKRMKLFSIDK